MSCAVFLRGVNVGGHRKFLPSALAKEMSALDVVNLGAAGTFGVRSSASEKILRREFARRLSFETELLVCPAKEILALAASDPFASAAAPKEAKSYVSILPKAPDARPRFPLLRPGSAWEVKLLGLSGRFVFSLHRRRGKGVLYPNGVVEKIFGVAATTRNWNTIVSLAELLKP